MIKKKKDECIRYKHIKSFKKITIGIYMSAYPFVEDPLSFPKKEESPIAPGSEIT